MLIFGAVPMRGDDVLTTFLKAAPRSAADGARVATVTAPTTDFTKPEAFETRPAGAATVSAQTGRAGVARPLATLPPDAALDFLAGQGLFRKIWVAAPASTLGSDGLGPVFNARSCDACHSGAGRGTLPDSTKTAAFGLVLHIGVPASFADPAALEAYLAQTGADIASPRPHPVYGAQLQDFAVQGQRAEYRLRISYDDVRIALSDADAVTLRAPTYRINMLGYGPLGESTLVSPRMAPQMFGLGLLEAISPVDILAAADPTDRNKDGISGRAQILWSRDFAGQMVGRFGHKAGTASLRAQSALAFHTDIGLSTPLFPAGAGDCTLAQADCRAARDGNSGNPQNTEVGALGLDLVTLYASAISLPARRDIGVPGVLRGKQIFYETGCVACHAPKFVTQTLPDDPARSFQLIWPYSDLLLHDMGPDLGDDLPEGVASGREWRTAPLWGIGLQPKGAENYLHDGRARTVLEAILWHGGEAEPARNRVVKMPSADRAALLQFLESL